MVTYAIKWDEKILVTSENKESLVWYKFVQEELSQKESDILKYKELEKKAINLRSQYITAEMMPEWRLKEKKLAKILAEWEKATKEYNLYISELIEEYSESILDELI